MVCVKNFDQMIKLRTDCVFSWQFGFFFLSQNMYAMTVSVSSWYIIAACLSKLIKISSSNLFYEYWPRLLMKIKEYSILFTFFWICNLFLIGNFFVWTELSDNSKAIFLLKSFFRSTLYFWHVCYMYNVYTYW